MLFDLSRRQLLQWAGVAAVSGPALVACTKDKSSTAPSPGPTETLPSGPPMGMVPAGDVVVNNKKYPFSDPDTGELLYHEPIRFAPRPGSPRSPRTSAVDLLEHQPARIESKGGVLDVDLDIAFADVVVNGQTMNLRTYNGTFPGPTLVTRPGDTLRIREVNKLPAEGGPPHTNVNHPHGFNHTNLHTHGLNVSPEDSEDNVLIEIHPGQSFTHQVHIPADHPAGTFWYHPHKHGSSACQVGSGMAGVLLITDPQTDVRAVREVGAAREVALVFQELYVKDRTEDGVGEVPGIPTSVAEYFYSDIIRTEQTVNGVASMELNPEGKVITPQLRMRPGEVQHWRMVHGGIFQNWLFGIDGHASHIIAYDGITLEKPETVDEFLMTSGQRRDILVQASRTPGTYAVKRKRYKQGEQVNTWPEITLFNIVVEGEPTTMGLPTALNPPVKRLPYVRDDEIVYKRTVPFDFIDDTPKGIFLFTIDNKVFKPGRVDFGMVLGTAEEWTITNNPSSDHPFHIHVNWFELVKVTDGGGKETVYDPPIWMDTANIPANGQAVVRMRFEKFQGKAVFHCHFLTHEDEGMMSIIEMVDGSPRTERVTPAGGIFLSRDYENKVQVRFLEGSVESDTDVTWQLMASPNVPTVNPAPALPKTMADYNTFFSLTAKQGDRVVTELARPATIEVKYSGAQVDTHVSLEHVNLYYYDERVSTWVVDGVSMIDRTSNLLRCSTRRLGRFAVSGRITPCFDFVAPIGIGPEDITPILDNKDSPYAYFKAPYDVAPAGAPDGVLDDKDIQMVLNARGAYCGPTT